jgi:hypothetical protein
MSTTMVITTVVTTDVEIEMDVEKVKQSAFDHVRNHEQTLVKKLTDQGVEAQVTTAIFDVNQLLDYLRLRRQAERDQAATPAPTPSVAVDPARMSEWEFVAYTLQQQATGAEQPTVSLSAEAVAAIEEEQIGEELSRYPFLY